MRLLLVAAATIRGVSLGGWLVLEPWITPQLFEQANAGVPKVNGSGGSGPGSFAVVDEYSWRAAPQGLANRSQLLVEHWQTWVQEEHIDQLHQAGITHLRIPVGYWYWNVTKGEPFEQTQALHPIALAALKQLVNEWAGPRHIKVLIDLHTAPGSQNGFDNSGRRTTDPEFQTPENLAHWAAALDGLTAWVLNNLDRDAVFGIEVLNEPAGFRGTIWDTVKTYINPQGYATVRRHDPQLSVVFETGFQPLSGQPVYPEPTWHNIWFDQHTYQCFGGWNDLSAQPDGWDQHLSMTCGAQMKEYSNSSGNIWAFCGEWSLAVTDCTIYLTNGMNGGCDMAAHPECKYNATPSDEICAYYNQPYDKFPAEYRDFLGKFARAQMDSFEAAQGWFFWTFRTENNHAPAWDFLLGWQQGWIPKRVDQREPYCAPQQVVV